MVFFRPPFEPQISPTACQNAEVYKHLLAITAYLPRIDKGHSRRLKISDVASDNRHAMHNVTNKKIQPRNIGYRSVKTHFIFDIKINVIIWLCDNSGMPELGGAGTICRSG